MVEFPLGVFGIALGTVMLPSLSRQFARHDGRSFSATIDWALRLIVVIAIPATVGLAVLSFPILTTLFHYGAFSDHDVAMSSLSLMAYSLGLAGFVGVKVLVPGFTARQDMKTPVRVAIIAMFTNIILNLALVGPLDHVGLALATSLAAFVNAGLLFWYLKREGIFAAQAGWLGLVGKVLGANVVMGVFIWWAKGDASLWLQADLSERIFRLGILVAMAIVVYCLILAALGLRPNMFRLSGRST